MYSSIIELYTIGIGPSSSHTVAPLRAAGLFLDEMQENLLFTQISQVEVEFFGSLALTGKGHNSHIAVILGLEGYRPHSIESNQINGVISKVYQENSLNLSAQKLIRFNPDQDITFTTSVALPQHTNGMEIRAFDCQHKKLFSKRYFSIGGGAVRAEDDFEHKQKKELKNVPFNFKTAQQLIADCTSNHLSIVDIMWANELVTHEKATIQTHLLNVWKIMEQAISDGCKKEGELPGKLKVKRRAKLIYEKLLKEDISTPSAVFDWVSLYAIAVNEENASGSKIITSPTNGAAGIIPAVLKYYFEFIKKFNESDLYKFLLTAGAIEILFQKGASISGAQVGCQGEVGVACSMASAGLTALLGGDIYQIENAAEIGMEHHLGLTCDPIGGQVQIPCIERNAMGAITAINASRLALLGSGTHYVSLDKVIATMRQTGADMNTRYKETSLGGLAVNFPEC